MSALVDSCSKPEKHEPHWLVAPPEGGVGGVRCEGNPRIETEFARLQHEAEGNARWLLSRWEDEVKALTAERDAYRARLDEVREILAPEWTRGMVLPAALFADTVARVAAIRAALDGEAQG
jgi:hypothetical protein